ncbi:ABC transporter substrate-binding protein [Thalassolituus sp. LLYu03]|uniref:ABC transporter substrate-binding protein n=1 Tax=Thalassolituus sp. LLYu03 TaxID=3421656 RepID=UPI003D2BBBE7
MTKTPRQWFREKAVRRFSTVVVLLMTGLLSACDSTTALWNDPHPASEDGQNIIYSSFSERPKHLDPARSYSSDEGRFIDQIYDAPLTYAYLKRPYELIPNTLTRMPDIRYTDAQGREVAENSPAQAFSTYEFELLPGIRYQPHPAFARTGDGDFVYRFQSAADAAPYHTLADFKQTGTRELTADDYLYQIKRLADPSLLSPVRGILAEYIVGMDEFSAAVSDARKALKKGEWLDLRPMTFDGIQASDDRHFSIRLKGKYPQFAYWLAFHFFAPMPWEADVFYHQPGMAERNIVLNWYPVGTGPFMMTRNDPNEVIILERNPNYRDDFYPSEGAPGDAEAGLLADAGKRLPLLDKAVYRLEKEAIPLWTKFLQGYYDRSGIASDNFDQAVRIGADGVGLSDDMVERGVTLEKEIVLGTYYFGFNMLDPVVGDVGTRAERERKRKLRQAIAIAYDQHEMINIFTNGRGEVAQGPIPPGIFGYQSGADGINPWVFDWVDGKPVRKSLDVARQLLKEAGYPDGRNVKTGEPLVLNLDTTGGGPGSGAMQNWMIKQFKKLNIQLNIRGSDYNRFKEKMEHGNAQMFQWGWLADYPDAENFLFLLYGPNGQVVSGGSGVNSSNYNNAEYNRLFEKMKLMENTPERMRIIRRMLSIVQQDTPWASAWHPHSYVLNNYWVHNTKAHGISKAVLKYYAIDQEERAQAQARWNKPVVWPLLLVALALALLAIPGVAAFRARQQRRIYPADKA